MSENYHTPVLLEKSLEYLNVKKDGIYCDLTLGGCGHFSAIVKRLGENAVAVGIDRDLTAVNRAKAGDFTAKCKIIIEQSPFSRFFEVLDKHKIEKIDGILMDLGVSSHQFDTKERGFSYRNDAKLDMRMDVRCEKNCRVYNKFF